MNKLAISVLAGAAVATSAFAGTEMSSSKEYKDMKQPIPLEPCFKDQEFQIDVFGTYNSVEGTDQHGDGFGGGVGVNYFFSRYVGVGIDGNIFDGGEGTEIWQATGQLIVRYPIELGSLCIAPYILGGGGVQTNSTTVGAYHVGGGLEYRATRNIGIFTEGRYIWTAGDGGDTAQARVGVRFVF